MTLFHIVYDRQPGRAFCLPYKAAAAGHYAFYPETVHRALSQGYEICESCLNELFKWLTSVCLGNMAHHTPDAAYHAVYRPHHNNHWAGVGPHHAKSVLMKSPDPAKSEDEDPVAMVKPVIDWEKSKIDWDKVAFEKQKHEDKLLDLYNYEEVVPDSYSIPVTKKEKTIGEILGDLAKVKLQDHKLPK